MNVPSGITRVGPVWPKRWLLFGDLVGRVLNWRFRVDGVEGCWLVGATCAAGAGRSSRPTRGTHLGHQGLAASANCAAPLRGRNTSEKNRKKKQPKLDKTILV